MSDFAVHHEGIPEGQGRWVLHVDTSAERVLLSEDDGSFYWRDLKDCTIARASTPDQPTLVLPVQPSPQQNGLVVAEPNRAMRRNGGY